jgi:excisionase family DNA binding protein
MEENNTNKELWVEATEVMKYLSLPKSTFEKLIKQGMPVLRIGKVRRFKLSQVEKWLQEITK